MAISYYNLAPTEGIKIEAFDLATNISVGIYESRRQCTRKLFIRNTANVRVETNKEGKPRFTTSYKTGKKYYFKEIK